jgi:hypothetical protein
MHHGACMVKLTRLPPSKHVLMLSTPLISKIKNKLRIAMSSNINLEEFYSIKNKCKLKNIFRLLLCWSHRYSLPSLVESKIFPA